MLLKLRIWDKKKNVFIDSDICWFCGNISDNAKEHSLIVDLFTNNYDKNGIRIYENDIVKDMKTGSHYIVTYSKSKAAFIFQSAIDRMCCGCLGNMTLDPTLAKITIGQHNMEWVLPEKVTKENVVIVGNVHQNPDMLGKVKE